MRRAKFDDPSRHVILRAIFSHLQMVTQWPTGHDAEKYYAKAEALVELLEVDDCGSIGGFDKSNPLQRITRDDVFDRFLTLLRKWPHSKASIDPSCNADVDTLTEYFKRLQSLRDVVYSEFPAKV